VSQTGFRRSTDAFARLVKSLMITHFGSQTGIIELRSAVVQILCKLKTGKVKNFVALFTRKPERPPPDRDLRQPYCDRMFDYNSDPRGLRYRTVYASKTVHPH
jgi:hypothetical protein